MMQRSLVLRAPGAIAWVERPMPSIEDSGQAIVRPLAVARCDLDRPIATGRVPLDLDRPFELGHECVAEVIAVGDDVRVVRVGDVVSVPFQISCGVCANCRAGRTASCEAVPALSAYGLAPYSGREWGGAMSDALLVPFADAMLVPIPRHVPAWVAAAAGDNVVDGWRAVAEPLRQRVGETVLVVGGAAPSIGLYAVASARALGASQVTYVDTSIERLTIAEQLGATVVESRPRPGAGLGRFAVTVDASAQPEGLRLALESAAVEGICTSVSVYPNDVSVPMFAMYTKGVRLIVGRANVRAALPEVLAHIANESLPIERVVTARASWEDAAEAWLAPATKLVIERSDERK